MSIAPEEYKEPRCVLCDDFYTPDADAPNGTIPVRSVLEKADGALRKNDFFEAERLYRYWLKEARELRDRKGELSILSELMGLYRKTNRREEGLRSVEEGMALVDALSLKNSVSGATVMLNAATTYKAFGFPEKGIPLYEETESVYKKELFSGDGRFAGLYNNFALALADTGRIEEAEKYYAKALSVLKNIPHSENEAAVTCVNLAHLYDGEGKDESYVWIEKAIEYLNAPDLPHDGNHAFVLSKCLPSLDYFGYFAAKEQLEKRMKEIYERA